MCSMRAVGEPINKEAWEWFYHVVGGQRCDIIDTWWQTGARASRTSSRVED